MPGQRVAADEALNRVVSATSALISESRLNYDQVDITCDAAHLIEVMTILRDADELRCRFFTFLSAVDRSAAGTDDDKSAGGGEAAPSKEPAELEVLIHVYSPDYVLHVNVHVPVRFAAAEVPSITGVYAGAQWHERETWEMFGIEFPGHPRLVNLYLPEDFEGHPLLKSFKLPGRSVKEWPGAKDPEEAAAGGR